MWVSEGFCSLLNLKCRQPGNDTTAGWAVSLQVEGGSCCQLLLCVSRSISSLSQLKAVLCTDPSMCPLYHTACHISACVSDAMLPLQFCLWAVQWMAGLRRSLLDMHLPAFCFSLHLVWPEFIELSILFCAFVFITPAAARHPVVSVRHFKPAAASKH